MEVTTEITVAGLKVYSAGKHIKTTKSVLQPVIQDLDWVEDETKKRLTPKEEFYLHAMAHLNNIVEREPKYAPYIKGQKPVELIRVLKREEPVSYEMRLTNKLRFKVPYSLYRMGVKAGIQMNQQNRVY